MGSTLHFASDKSVTAVVHDDRKVKYKGKIMFLTQSARIVLRSKHGEGKYNNLSGPKYWKYKNELLDDRRHRLETQKSSRKKSSNQSSIFSFSSAGIPMGSTLHFASDKSVTAVVHDDRKVKYKGKIMFLTQSARIVLRSKHGKGKYNNLSGPKYWKYKNELLTDRRHRIEKSGRSRKKR